MWDNGYHYTIGVLKTIASYYRELYEGISFTEYSEVVNPHSLAEFKVDFEYGLSYLGRKFKGVNGLVYKDFKGYPGLQRIVIADIFFGGGILTNWQLTRLKDGDIIKLRKTAYREIRDFLNGE